MCDTPFYKQVEYKTGAHTQLQTLALPCGKCLPCRKTTQAQWLFRLEQDLKQAESAYFVTLTYNEKYLPITPTGFPTLNYKQDVQSFIKRLRRYHDKYNTKPISYFVVGEYGTNNYRPHYHLIIYNAVEKYIRKAWQQLNLVTREREVIGQVDIGTVTSSSIQYCLNYTDKDKNKPTGWKDSDDEFRIMSKGIGSSYIGTHLYRKNRNMDYVALSNGSKIAMPKYYTNKALSDVERQVRGKQISQKLALQQEQEIRTLGIEQFFKRESTAKQGNKILQKSKSKKRRS